MSSVPYVVLVLGFSVPYVVLTSTLCGTELFVRNIVRNMAEHGIKGLRDFKGLNLLGLLEKT